jgi:general secretion pathway protein N
MSRRTPGYLLLGLVLGSIVLAARAPAVLVAWGLERWSGGRAQLDEAHGTVWSGEGALVLRAPDQSPHRLARIGWELDFWPLLRGRLNVRAHGSGPEVRLAGAAELAFGTIALRELHIVLPAAVATAFYAPAQLLAPTGQLELTAPALDLAPTQVRGQGELHWRAAAIGLSPVRPLGDYRLYFEGQGEQAALRLETLRGPLAVSGTGQWQAASGALRFDGAAAPIARATELEPLLRLFGSDAGGGRRTLAVNVQLDPHAFPH